MIDLYAKTCRDCGKSEPEIKFSATDTRNLRCVGPNGCQAAYRKKLREEKKASTVDLKSSVDRNSLIAEMLSGRRYAIAHLTMPERKERRRIQKNISKIVYELPERRRELAELNRLVEMFKDTGLKPEHHSVVSQKLRNPAFSSYKRALSPELDDRSWPAWMRRRQLLEEKFGDLPAALLERGYDNEMSRLISEGVSEAAFDAEHAAELEALLKRLEENRIKRASEIVTVEAGAAYLARFECENEASDQYNLLAAKCAFRAEKSANSKVEKSKWEGRADNAAAEATAEMQANFEAAVDYHSEKLRAILAADPALTWADFLPEVYSAEALAAPIPVTVVREVSPEDILAGRHGLLTSSDFAMLEEWISTGIDKYHHLRV